MIAKLPKWLLYGTVLGVLIAVLMLISRERVMLPGDYQKANSALSEDDYDLAIGHYIACIERLGLRGPALGSIERRAEEALADCDEALILLPDQPEILDSRALAYWLLDEHAKAQQDLERAWRLDPSRRTWQERFREFEGMF